MIKNSHKVIAIVGPTASGKTAYSINLAKEVKGEIISADSRLVYKDFNIGTAKPTVEEMGNVPHYMIDIVEPTFDYSVGLYVESAKSCINDILSRGKTPIVVGGTGLYINALLMNYDFPKVKPDYKLREQLMNEPDVYSILCDLDFESAKKIEKNDTKKIIRSIEVIKLTGQKLSLVRKINESEFEIEWIGKNFERNELYQRINQRVDSMMENGLLDETKFLLNKYGRINNVINTIGYSEMVEFLDGILSLEQAVNKLKQNTRRYAKRQLTWFRKNTEISWDIYPDVVKK